MNLITKSCLICLIWSLKINEHPSQKWFKRHFAGQANICIYIYNNVWMYIYVYTYIYIIIILYYLYYIIWYDMILYYIKYTYIWWYKHVQIMVSVSPSFSLKADHFWPAPLFRHPQRDSCHCVPFFAPFTSVVANCQHDVPRSGSVSLWILVGSSIYVENGGNSCKKWEILFGCLW